MIALKRPSADRWSALIPIHLIVSAVLSGLGMALFTLSEWPWLFLGFIALVPWLAALDRVKSIIGVLFAGLLMSEAYVLSAGYWIPSVAHSYSGVPWWLGLLLTVLSAPLIQPQFFALALARYLARAWGPIPLIPSVPLAGAFAYVAADWAIPKVIPDTLGHMLFGSVLLRQAADVAGALGLTFLVLMANECVLLFLKNISSYKRTGAKKGLLIPAVCLVLLIALPLGYGAVRHHQFTNNAPDEKPVTVALVQSGFSHFTSLAADYGEYLTVRTVLDTHVALSREAMTGGSLDLIVWPESVYPLPFGSPLCETGAALDRRIEEFVIRTGVPLVFGAHDLEDGMWYNTAFFIEPLPDGSVVHNLYRKRHLFPFIEYAPGIFGRDIIRRHLPWLGTYTPGPGAKTLSIKLPDGRFLRVIPLICYDALNPDHTIAAVRDGGEVILTLSNDSWFEYGNVPRNILNISAFRSIETRRPQLRATATGISAVITPTGEIVDMLDTQEQGAIVGSVVPGSGRTLMLIFGDWFGPFSLAAAALILVMPIMGRRKKRRPQFGKNH